MKLSIAAIVTLAALFAQAEESLTGVTARQRWPWNGVVDIDFTLNGNATENYKIEVEAHSAKSGAFYAKTYLTDPVVASGVNRISWDFGKDYPNVKADDVAFSVSAVPLAEADKPTYMVIDVSGGKDATHWPVRYTSFAPTHTPKDTNDVCKLTEIWLKRVHPKGENFCQHTYTSHMGDSHFFVRLTKDYYIGIFEVTQRQWYQMTGDWKGYCSNPLWRDTRPVDNFYSNLLFGDAITYHSNNRTPVSGSVLERMINKTGLTTINLPTEAQWVYAMHGGPCTLETWRYRESYPNGRIYDYSEIARYKDNSGSGYSSAAGAAECDLDNGSAAVGCYTPNVLGLYDMIGNVAEEMLDPYLDAGVLKQYYTDSGVEFPLVDPKGITGPNVLTLQERPQGPMGATMCCSGYGSSTDYQQCWYRYKAWASYCSDSTVKQRGLRLCVTVE